MSEVNQDELTTLKARADMMGIAYHPSIGLAKLKEKVNGILEESTAEESNIVNSLSSGDPGYITHAEYKRKMLATRKKRAGSLIRINVSCMNPNKKEWEGEIISVGSAKLGTFKKYIPFNTTEGWHVPYIIYEAMKERKCSIFQTVKDHLGNKVRKAKLINEFTIEILPSLDKDELKALAQRQAVSGSIDK